MAEILSRGTWKARPPRSRYAIETPTKELWLHHTAGAEDAGHNNRWADDLAGIQNFHMDGRGWSDIAYSFLVDSSGQIWEGRGAGIKGAHTLDRNKISHGICAIGNYEVAFPSQAMTEAIAQLVAHGQERGWWEGGITGPHSAAPKASTACCGRNLAPLIARINTRATEIRNTEPIEQPTVATAHPNAGTTGHLINDCLAELDAITRYWRGKALTNEELDRWTTDLVGKVYVEGATDLSGVTRWAFWALSQE